MTEALEESCKAVRVLCDRMESECSICAANAYLLHSVWLWKLLGSFVVFLAVCIALTVLVCHKLK